MRSSWWTALTSNARPEELPILTQTRRDLGRLLTDDLVPRRRLAMALMSDPALALRVLLRANAVTHRHRQFRADVVMLEDAAHMLGTQTLLSVESEASLAEAVLDPMRLAHYRRGAGRAVLAALLAYDWAEIDRDRFPSEVSLAALLNNLGELFLLAHGDARIRRYLELVDTRQVLPHEAEYVSLGESLEELGYELATRWGLPEMVREAMRARNAQHPRTLCVMLATQIARYALSDWRHPHPMQAGDLRLVAAMLNLDAVSLDQRINRVLTDFNRMASHYGLAPLRPVPMDTGDQAVLRLNQACPVYFCLAPRQDDFVAAVATLHDGTLRDRDAVFATLLRGLHRGLGLNRVVFANYDPRKQSLTSEFLIGTDFEPSFNRFSLSLDAGWLFDRLLNQPNAFWMNDVNRPRLWPEMPARVSELIGVRSFFIHSISLNGRPVGLVYADRRSESCALDARSFAAFEHLVGLATRCLERLDGG